MVLVPGVKAGECGVEPASQRRVFRGPRCSLRTDGRDGAVLPLREAGAGGAGLGRRGSGRTGPSLLPPSAQASDDTAGRLRPGLATCWGRRPEQVFASPVGVGRALGGVGG